jgi:hypothetical protein
MMLSEDKKFLDLDHLCDSIISQDDRAMFLEAIRCYQVGSHRAAVILAWCVTAECLYRRIDDLANEGDGVANNAKVAIQNVAGMASYEENLIAKAKECELFDDYDEKCLRFARDTRSKCAHPTGVVPSAEAVRHILHICSQVVLCRAGYRGMSFVRNFVGTKLNDQHLFPDPTKASEVSNYYIAKVPTRLHAQFASELVTRITQSTTAHFRPNTIRFFEQLVTQSNEETAKRIFQKLEGLVATDIVLHSVFVGLETREHVLDAPVRSQAKNHLRDNLKQGPVEKSVFHSFANLCAIGSFDHEDSALVQSRFAAISESLSNHSLLLDRKRTELLVIVNQTIGNSSLQVSIFKGLLKLGPSQLFDGETQKVDELISALIASDWQDEDVKQLWNSSSTWSNTLKSRLLRQSESYLLECSEDFPETVLPLLEAAEKLISDNVTLLPDEFEETIANVVNGVIHVDWYQLAGEAFRSFVGQVDLLRTRHQGKLPKLAALTLPSIIDDDPEEES